MSTISVGVVYFFDLSLIYSAHISLEQNPPLFCNMFSFSIKVFCPIIRGLVYMIVIVFKIWLLLKCMLFLDNIRLLYKLRFISFDHM
jgi:hypothetical protein